MTNESRDKLRGRVNRVGGQVAGIGRMIDEDKYCVEILNQIAAARSALDAIGVELLADHLQTCVLGHGGGDEHECAKPLTGDELVEEVRTVVRRFLK
ncbi:MAG: metal-sensitive transcriptional regulator [Fibrella sp.]|nr:metal-sensitive transcriptional regulator [Armatimonadota bacterium]